ncbi:hypothetical protein P9112_006985 [Eukaryota sp. TZLM1-RC]
MASRHDSSQGQRPCKLKNHEQTSSSEEELNFNQDRGNQGIYQVVRSMLHDLGRHTENEEETLYKCFYERDAYLLACHHVWDDVVQSHSPYSKPPADIEPFNVDEFDRNKTIDEMDSYLEETAEYIQFEHDTIQNAIEKNSLHSTSV